MKRKKWLHDLNKNLIFSISLNILIVIFETIFGLLIGSMALITDALHNLLAITSISLGLRGERLVARQVDVIKTYRDKRADIIVACINSSVIVAALLFIFIKSFQRLIHPTAINGLPMIAVALAAFIGNTLAAYFLERDSCRNLNVRIAWLHSLKDALYSLIIVFGAIWFIIDPVISIILALIIFNEAWKIIVDAVNIFMGSVSRDIDHDEVKAYLLKLPGVEAVKDLHIWQTDPQNRLMSVHLKIERLPEEERMELIHSIQELMRDKFRINYTTIQTTMVDANGKRKVIEVK